MPNRKLVRRPEWDLHSDRGGDSSGDWRRFVLEQVGYDEVARERVALRTERRRTVRRFIGGVLLGLIVFALAFAAVFAARLWREGRFDRYLPKAGATIEASPSLRRMRAGPPDATESHDTHVIQQNPFASPPHPSPPVDPEDDAPPPPETAPAGDDG